MQINDKNKMVAQFGTRAKGKTQNAERRCNDDFEEVQTNF
ncbi:predicted protein [Botrytis cinerea T4]|uniref:Uncharacterized protein n=1 Tax=Botryotinia fuckeliana (strain T4) TaxID=999810 RepID=G2YBV9_BOTF4|nr:predicted protein [Botrytis cinerea T4]